MENNCTICVHRGSGQENVERCLLVNVPYIFYILIMNHVALIALSNIFGSRDYAVCKIKCRNEFFLAFGKVCCHTITYRDSGNPYLFCLCLLKNIVIYHRDRKQESSPVKRGVKLSCKLFRLTGCYQLVEIFVFLTAHGIFSVIVYIIGIQFAEMVQTHIFIKTGQLVTHSNYIFNIMSIRIQFYKFVKVISDIFIYKIAVIIFIILLAVLAKFFLFTNVFINELLPTLLLPTSKK